VYSFDQEAPPSEDDFDELISCRPAFQVLKQLVQRCVSDVVSSGNVFADAVLQHVYRWICRQVYDSLLCHVVISKKYSRLWYGFHQVPDCFQMVSSNHHGYSYT
jgi:Domain of unknown function (DUF1744)